MEWEEVMVFFPKNRQCVDSREQSLQTVFYRKTELYLLYGVMECNLTTAFCIT